MDTVSVSNAQSLLFNMSRQAETEAKEPNTGVEVVAVASTEAAAFAPPGFFISPVSVSDAPESSAQPSPADAGQQELQLHPPPAPVQEQRTIFVAGFPLDMTEREFHCLLTFLPGYEACQLSWGTGAPQGFALFKCNLDAASAVERLAGHQVEVGAVLRAELAHKNLVIKKDVPTVNGNSQLTLLGNIQARTDALVLPNPGLGLPFTNMFHTPAQPIMTHTGYTTVATPSGLAGSPSLMPQHWRPLSNARDNVPCNTLFIGNLGESTREEELHQLMASQPGFRQLKWSPTGKGIIAFVEFDDVATASYVHQAMQGVVLPSNERGGIRIQYSKNPLGKRSPLDTAPNLHGLFGTANPVSSAGFQAQALYNATLVNSVGMAGMAPPTGYLLELPGGAHQAATAAAMAAAAAAAATQGMVGSAPLFGPVGTMLL